MEGGCGRRIHYERKFDSGGEGQGPIPVDPAPPGTRCRREFKNDFFARTLLVEAEGRALVLKVSRWGSGLIPFLRPFEEYASRRERRALEALDGVPGIPRLHPARGRNFLLREFIPGATLAERRDEGEPFLDRLEAVVRRAHARGVAGLDLSKRENVVVGDDGEPYLVDFQISLVRGAGRIRGRLFRHLADLDLYHLRKRRLHLRRSEKRSQADRDAENGAPWSVRWHRRLLRKPWLAIVRRFREKGAGERPPPELPYSGRILRS